MSFAFAIVLSLLTTESARAGYVCAEGASGGSCYGALGGPRSARFQSYSWGGEVFVATYAGHSYRCTANGPEVFAKAAASTGYLAVSWDQYHRCTVVDFGADAERGAAIASALVR